MEEICNSLESCELCTVRGCRWLLLKGKCIWEGVGKVATELWECEDGSTTTTTTTNNNHHHHDSNNNPVPSNADPLIQATDDGNLVLVVVMGIMLGLLLLGGVALGVHMTLRRRLERRNTSVSHTRLLDAMGYESDTLMSRIRQQLSPRSRPQPPATPINPPPPPPPTATTPKSSSSSAQSSPASASTMSPPTLSPFTTPFSTPSLHAAAHSSSTPRTHGGQRVQTHYFDSTPESHDEMEMVDLTPTPPPTLKKEGYSLRSHKK